MLHYNVQVIIGDQVLQDPNSAVMVYLLQGHCLFDLHHDTCFELRTSLLVILKLFDEQEGLRVLVLCDVGFNGGEQFFDGVWLKLRLIGTSC